MFDREFSDIFAVQNDIAARVVAAVEPALYIEEGSRAARAETINAWSLVVRSIGLFHRLDCARNEEACALLRRAISLEPSNARAHALLGWRHGGPPSPATAVNTTP